MTDVTLNFGEAGSVQIPLSTLVKMGYKNIGDRAELTIQELVDMTPMQLPLLLPELINDALTGEDGTFIEALLRSMRVVIADYEGLVASEGKLNIGLLAQILNYGYATMNAAMLIRQTHPLEWVQMVAGYIDDKLTEILVGELPAAGLEQRIVEDEDELQWVKGILAKAAKLNGSNIENDADRAAYQAARYEIAEVLSTASAADAQDTRWIPIVNYDGLEEVKGFDTIHGCPGVYLNNRALEQVVQRAKSDGQRYLAWYGHAGRGMLENQDNLVKIAQQAYQMANSAGATSALAYQMQFEVWKNTEAVYDLIRDSAASRGWAFKKELDLFDPTLMLNGKHQWHNVRHMFFNARAAIGVNEADVRSYLKAEVVLEHMAKEFGALVGLTAKVEKVPSYLNGLYRVTFSAGYFTAKTYVLLGQSVSGGSFAPYCFGDDGFPTVGMIAGTYSEYLTLSGMVTLAHELGHAIQGMIWAMHHKHSFVSAFLEQIPGEVYSTALELYASTRRFLATLPHEKTGEQLGEEIAIKLAKSIGFGEGYNDVRLAMLAEFSAKLFDQTKLIGRREVVELWQEVQAKYFPEFDPAPDLIGLAQTTHIIGAHGHLGMLPYVASKFAAQLWLTKASFEPTAWMSLFTSLNPEEVN